MSPVEYQAPTQSSPADMKTYIQAIKNTFPESIVQQNPATGQRVVWKHIVPLLYSVNPLDALLPESQLIDKSLGELAVYTADGNLPATAGHQMGQYALAFRNGGDLKLLKMDFAQHQPMPSAMIYPWQNLTKRVDATSGRIFLFFDGEFLEADKANTPGWRPFNSWWFDPRAVTLQHVVLPDGPWVADASSFSPVRESRNFPIGASARRHYDIKVAGTRVFILITAFNHALDEATTGIYVLQSPANTWLKIAAASVGLEQIAPDGCKLAVNQSSSVEIVNLCR